MAKLSVPYLKLRPSAGSGCRPRWEPGPHLRARGFRGVDLKDRDGNWLAEGPAIEEARRLNEAARSSRALSDEKSVNAPDRRTVRALIELFKASESFKRLGHRTARGYKQHFKLIEEWAGEDLALQLSINAVEDLHRKLFESRGAATANAVLRTIKLLLYFGCSKKVRWLKDNNAVEIEMFPTDGRRVMWELAEMAHVIATADRLEMFGQGDAFVVGAFSGQRQSDVIGLLEGDLRPDMYVLKTRKTNALAKVPAIKQLIDRVHASRARKKTRWPNVTFQHEIICDRTGRPYRANDDFGKEWRIVRAEAAKTMPAIATKRWQDLRDTAVTLLFLAQCTDAEIATVTGHSLSTVRAILDKHYFVRVDAFTLSAGNKLEAYLTRSGW